MGGERGRDKRQHGVLEVVQRYVDVSELTPTIVNEYIKKIIVYAPDKSSGHRKQKVKIFWNFLDEIDIPDIERTVVYQRPLKTQKTA